MSSSVINENTKRRRSRHCTNRTLRVNAGGRHSKRFSDVGAVQSGAIEAGRAGQPVKHSDGRVVVTTDVPPAATPRRRSGRTTGCGGAVRADAIGTGRAGQPVGLPDRGHVKGGDDGGLTSLSRDRKP